MLIVRTYGLGLAVGGVSIATWLWVSSLIELGSRPIGIADRNPGADDTVPHAVTSVGMVSTLALLAIAAVLAIHPTQPPPGNGSRRMSFRDTVRGNSSRQLGLVRCVTSTALSARRSARAEDGLPTNGGPDRIVGVDRREASSMIGTQACSLTRAAYGELVGVTANDEHRARVADRRAARTPLTTIGVPSSNSISCSTTAARSTLRQRRRPPRSSRVACGCPASGLTGSVIARPSSTRTTVADRRPGRSPRPGRRSWRSAGLVGGDRERRRRIVGPITEHPPQRRLQRRRARCIDRERRCATSASIQSSAECRPTRPAGRNSTPATDDRGRRGRRSGRSNAGAVGR